MGKIKSAICITLFTLIIAALCFVCTVSFSYGTDGMYTFNSILRMTAKDADLGGAYGSDGYMGGGYSAVYYPDGVISAKEYEDNLGGYEEGSAKQEEYRDQYVAYENGAIYLDKDIVCGGKEEPTESFKEAFESTREVLANRYASLKKDGVRLEVRDGYTFRVFLAKDIMDSELFAFTANAYMGEFTVRYGSDADSATTIMPERSNKTIGDYFKGASARTSADGTAYVVLDFTEEGQEVVKTQTASSNTMYFMVGENTVIPLTVSEQIDQATLYISGSYTGETAEICATVINTVLNETNDSVLELSVSDALEYGALYGENALTGLYIAFAVLFVAMAVFFFVRYHLLGFVHLYTYLLFFFVMVLCVWSIPFVYLSVESLVAFLICSLLLGVSNVVTFECARGEFALGKTMTSSVKTGYKKCFWHLFDLHIVLAVLSFIMFGIGLSNLSLFAFVLGLGTVFSGLCTLGLNRFMWAIMMAFTPNKGKFCNFKRTEVEDDD